MTVYCFSSSTAMSVYIAMKYLKATKVVRFELPTQGFEDYEAAVFAKRVFYRLLNSLKGVKIESIPLNTLTEDTLELHWAKSEPDDVILLPPATKAMHMPIYPTLMQSALKKIFVESDGELFAIEANQVTPIVNDTVNLKIKDFISQYNGRILSDNSELFRQPVANLLLDYFIKNMNILEPVLKHAKPMKRLDFGAYQPGQVSPYSTVDFSLLKPVQRNVYTKSLELLAKNHVIQLTQKGDTAEVYFRDVRYREYFSKAGTWFEHLTQRTLDELPSVNNILSSVFFTWDDTLEIEKNEIDIMAVFENKLVAISCKATAKLTDEYLYELESHSDYLSGDAAIMILATTAEPTTLIRERADRLNVHLVIYRNSLSEFKQQFLDILKTYQDQ